MFCGDDMGWEDVWNEFLLLFIETMLDFSNDMILGKHQETKLHRSYNANYCFY